VLEPALVEIEVDWWNVGDPKYIGTIPLSGDPRCVAAQSHSCWPPAAVMSGIIAKVGAAARLSQSAAVRAAPASLAPRLRPAAELATWLAPGSAFRDAAPPASDTLTHCGSTDFSAS
jgi:hypothetical protein